MRHPVREKECIVFRKQTLIEDQTASYRGQRSRADSEKSATRKSIFGAVILHFVCLLQNTPGRKIVAILNAYQGPHAKMQSAHVM